MRPPTLPDLQNIKTFDQLKNFVTQNVKSFYAILNKGGFFLDQMNVAYKQGVILDNGTDTEVVHNLGSVPIGYIVIQQGGNGVVRRGDRGWNSTSIYLQSNTSMNCDLLILKG